MHRIRRSKTASAVLFAGLQSIRMTLCFCFDQFLKFSLLVGVGQARIQASGAGRAENTHKAPLGLLGHQRCS